MELEIFRGYFKKVKFRENAIAVVFGAIRALLTPLRGSQSGPRPPIFRYTGDSSIPPLADLTGLASRTDKPALRNCFRPSVSERSLAKSRILQTTTPLIVSVRTDSTRFGHFSYGSMPCDVFDSTRPNRTTKPAFALSEVLDTRLLQ